jgi:hypothetical protein
MNKSMGTNREGISFEEQFLDISDQEIVNILKLRKHYQPEAARAAINEALKRGLIHAEDDLLGEQFRPQSLGRPSIFPVGNTEAQNVAIVNSLCRIMYGISLIPLIMTYYQFDNGKILGAIIHLIAALVVIAVTYRLNRTKRSFLAHLLLAFNVPVMGYAFYLLAEKGIPTTMDAVATAVVLLTILYTTLSLNFVTAKLQRNIEQPEQER